MAGIFGNGFFGEGGLLGGGNYGFDTGNEAPQAAGYGEPMQQQQQGFLGGLGGWADRTFNNPMVQFGLGLASGRTPQEGMGNALGAIQMRQRLAQANLTGDIKEYIYAKQQGFRGTFAEWQKTQANLRDREQFGLTPVPYYDKETGEYRLGQATNKGNFKPIDIPGRATDQGQVIQTPQGAYVLPKRIVPGATGVEGGGTPGAAVPGGAQGGGFIKKEYEGPEESKKVGEGYGKEFTGIQDEGRKALAMKQTYTRMGQLNDQAYSGAAAPGIQYTRSLLETFGVDPGKVPQGEELTMLSNRLVLDATGGSLGNQISNADRDYIQATNPSLANTKEGRARMIDTGLKLANRKIEVARLASDYRTKNGSMKGFDQYIADYAEKNPLFPKEERSSGGTTKSGIKWSID